MRLFFKMSVVMAVLVSLSVLGLSAAVRIEKSTPHICMISADSRSAHSVLGCTSSKCYFDGSCGYRKHPSVLCDQVSVGDPVSKLYFRLGNPDLVSERKLAWKDTVEPEIVAVATIRDGQLVSLDCRSNPNSLALQWSPRSGAVK